MRPVPVGSRHLVGLIGADIGPSLTPPLHEREAERLGLGYAYERIDLTALGLAPERIGALLGTVRNLGFSGVNVTHPCKQLAVAHLDDLSPDAAALGAVNTVVFRDGRASGHNTDLPAFQRNFVRGLPDVDTGHVVVVGAGGAGAAVAHAALGLGVGRIVIVDTRHEHAEALAAALRDRYGAERARVARADAIARELRAADGVIHATPAGMETHPGTAFPPDLLHAGLWVADVVYRPLETELLREARERGCRTLDGGGMAVFQAALSFALFTGVEPDVGRMLRHFATLTEPTAAARAAGPERG